MSGERHILIMAGGTGGHVFPALSVARELRERGVAVSWLGTRRGIESRLVPAAAIPIHYIRVSGLRGMGWGARLAAPWQLLRATWQALRVLCRTKPDAVLGMGGFASGPGGLAARLLRIPVVIHEQNAVAGTTNRLLARWAHRIMEAFPDTLPKGEWCGNPVRPEIASLPPPQERLTTRSRRRERVRLLVLGGSLGANAINQLVPQALSLLPEKERPEVVHQSGHAHADDTRKEYEVRGVRGFVEAFVDDMAGAYEWADLVICRSGALTVAELAAAGIGSVLIPFPHAIDDHQTRNGEWLADRGAALVVQQEGITPENLAELLSLLLRDRPRLLDMACKAREAAVTDAASRVADACLEVCR